MRSPVKRSIWLALLVLAACAAGPKGTDYENLRSDGEPLRTDFDEAAGKVRAIVLVAPT